MKAIVLTKPGGPNSCELQNTGAVDSDLKFNTSGTATETVLDFYRSAIPASSVARAIAFAIEQPAEVDVNEIVLRPTRQEF